MMNAGKKYQVITDYAGRSIRLFDTTVAHIRNHHPEIHDPKAFVTAVLKDPILVTKDELPDTVIYHRSVKRPLLHIAYVQAVKGYVKSAHITDKIKGGEILWLKSTKDPLNP